MLNKMTKTMIFKNPMADIDMMNDVLEEFFKLSMKTVQDLDFDKSLMKANCCKFVNYTVTSNNNEVTVKLNIPGAVHSKLKAVLEDDVLKVTYALRDVEKDTEEPESTLEIKLPKAEYNLDDVESIYADGVLYIKLPKAKPESKTIRIAFM